MPEHDNAARFASIEEEIRNDLGGDAQGNALDFAAFLRANGFPIEWNGEHGGWNILCRGRLIVFSKVIGDENVFAIVFNTCDFGGGETADEDVKAFAWAHAVICPQGCGGSEICEMSQKRVTIFGRAFENVCIAPLECFNLDAHELQRAQKLMLMLKDERG